MTAIQDSLFSRSEGNSWFARNKKALDAFDPGKDFPLMLIKTYGLKPGRVLEVGASNGYRLAWLVDALSCSAVGVEPSADAIADGRARFPKVRFEQGIASEIPVREKLDLVIVNFVFHWIDRVSLLKSVSEVDRMVDDSGFLILGDFLPSSCTKVKYHHLPDEQVYTYKQNYAEMFLTSGLYHQVALHTSSTETKIPDPSVDSDRRFGVWLLRKSLTGNYNEKTFTV